MKLAVLLFLFALANAQAEEGCMVSIQAAIVPTSVTTVRQVDNRAADGVTREFYEDCNDDLYFVEEFFPGGVALKSTQYGTFLEPYVDAAGEIQIRLSFEPFLWQKELVSNQNAYYTEDTATFGTQGKYLSACWDWLDLRHQPLQCERFEFQYIPRK